jgi:hypothetical protein
MNTSTEWQQYQEMRKTGVQIRTEIMGLFPMNYIEKCARELGLIHEGKIHIQDYLQLLLLEDFALFNYGPTGIIAIEKHHELRKSSFSPIEERYIEAMLKSRYSIFHVTNSVPNLGVNVRDMLYGDTLFIVDERFQQGNSEGMLLACRSLVFPNFSMIFGSMQTVSDNYLPLLPHQIHQIPNLKDRQTIKDFERNLLFTVLYDSLNMELNALDSKIDAQNQ